MFFAVLSLLQALPEHLDGPVLLAPLDGPGGLEFLETAVIQDLLGSRAHLDRWALQERLALPVDREDQVRGVRKYVGSVNYLLSNSVNRSLKVRHCLHGVSSQEV